ncbi:MAG: hypothetical protein ABUS79_01490 [Pseudomonadota bacterium]
MQITARLDESTLIGLLRQLLPVTVTIDEDGSGDGGADRWIRIDPARQVAFVPDEGLRVEVGGQLRWKTAGMPVLLTINSAQLMVRPVIESAEEGERLVFRPSLERMDLKNVPEFVDSGVAAIINKRLARQGDSLAWHFGRTLRHEFPLAKEFVDVDRFSLAAGTAAVAVSADAFELTLRVTAAFTRAAEP